ncbi:MAG: S8 family peptidase [Gammaproteobacteria bacterium]
MFALTATAAVASAYADGPPQRIIVKYRATVTANDSLASANSARAMSDIGSRYGVSMSAIRRMTSGASVMKLDRELTEPDYMKLVSEVAASDNVEYAEPDRLLHATLTPNDTYYNLQWHYYEATGSINVPTAWDLSTGQGVTVAVIDTGYRPHADLAANIVGGYDFISDTFISRDGNLRDSDARDPGDWNAAGECGAGTPASDSSWHGTHVSGTIAARTNNGGGVAGVAFGARVLPVRVLGRCGGYTSDIADGLVWASGGTVSGVPRNPNPARVASLSLGGGGPCGTTMQNAVNGARTRGTVVVVAAGNERQNAQNSSPANCTGVVVVAATNRRGARAPYSNFGTIVDVAAPGGDQSTGQGDGVLSLLNTGRTTPANDTYAYYQGTSMATPHVSAVAALMLSVNPALTPAQVETTLRNTTRAFPGTCSQCGTGIVNARAAVVAASAAR